MTDTELSNLEWRVVEAAVALRKRNGLKFESECIKVWNEFDAATDALITAREASPSQVREPEWFKDKEIARLTEERNQLAQQGAELWERIKSLQSQLLETNLR